MFAISLFWYILRRTPGMKGVYTDGFEDRVGGGEG